MHLNQFIDETLDQEEIFKYESTWCVRKLHRRVLALEKNFPYQLTAALFDRSSPEHFMLMYSLSIGNSMWSHTEENPEIVVSFSYHRYSRFWTCMSIPFDFIFNEEKLNNFLRFSFETYSLREFKTYVSEFSLNIIKNLASLNESN